MKQESTVMEEMDRETWQEYVPLALAGLQLAWPHERAQGKVREMFALPGGRRLIVTTDRLSAFDRVLAAVPFKGQVLNQLSAFWFEGTAGLIPNHLLAVPDPNVSLVRDCTPLSIEVIVRGYISGTTHTALWYRYSLGERRIYGYDLPDGLVKNQQLPAPIITPTTKARAGEHDERIDCAEVVTRGLLDAATWERVQEAALALFRHGQEVARRGGIILVDTKYEFGRDAGGNLVLIDEVHTPDSSRFWVAASYKERLAAGLEPENLDKESVRLWYAEQGYRGDGEPPAPPPELLARMAERYVRLYEMLTGRAFVPAPYPAEPRIAGALQGYL